MIRSLRISASQRWSRTTYVTNKRCFAMEPSWINYCIVFSIAHRSTGHCNLKFLLKMAVTVWWVRRVSFYFVRQSHQSSEFRASCVKADTGHLGNWKMALKSDLNFWGYLWVRGVFAPISLNWILWMCFWDDSFLVLWPIFMRLTRIWINDGRSYW